MLGLQFSTIKSFTQMRPGNLKLCYIIISIPCPITTQKIPNFCHKNHFKKKKISPTKVHKMFACKFLLCFFLTTQIIINNQFVKNSRKIFLINYKKKTVSIETLWQKKNVHLPKNNIKIEWKLLNLNIVKKNWKLPSEFFFFFVVHQCI